MSRVGCSGCEDMVAEDGELVERRRWCTEDGASGWPGEAAVYKLWDGLPPASCRDTRDSRAGARGIMTGRLNCSSNGRHRDIAGLCTAL